MENKLEKLPKAIRSIWVVHAIFTLIFFLIIWIPAKLLIPVTVDDNIFSIYLWIILAIIIIIFVVQLAIIPYRWNFWTFNITENRVELHKGFFLRKQIVIPIARVQNVTLKQGPILQMFKLHEVSIVTAAENHKIDGLTGDMAQELKDLIMKLAKEARNDL